MSKEASTIDAIQQILSQPSWTASTIEEVSEVMVANGFDEWTKETICENRYLKQQLVQEIAESIGHTIGCWDEDQLGVEINDFTILGWAATIVTTIIDLNTRSEHASIHQHHH